MCFVEAAKARRIVYQDAAIELDRELVWLFGLLLVVFYTCEGNFSENLWA